MVKLMVMSPFILFIDPFFLPWANSWAKTGPEIRCFDITFAEAGDETTYLHEMFSWKKLFPPLFNSWKLNEALCHYAVLFHPTCGELLYPPHPQCTLSQHLVCKPACYTKKKLKSRNKVPAHASVLTRFTLLHSFNPLILKLSGFAPLYCICSSAFGCLIKGTGRESSAVTFIADLLKACF